MALYLPKILLWLFVINLGIAFGAGLYESRIVVPQWISSSPESGNRWNAEAAQRADTGLKFWVYVTTVPLTLLTTANLLAAWRAWDAIRRWWPIAAHGFGREDFHVLILYSHNAQTIARREPAPAGSRGSGDAVGKFELRASRHRAGSLAGSAKSVLAFR